MRLTELTELYILSLNGIRSPTTISTYKYKLATVAKAFRDMQVSEITEDIAQENFDNLSESYSSKMVHSLLDVTRAAFKYAVKEGATKSNPFSEICLGRMVNHEPVILTTEELDMVLDTVGEESALFLPILIAIETGLRRSQVLALTWNDVDFSKGEMTVEKNVVSSKNHIYTKGKERVERSIKMSSKLSGTLMMVLNTRRDNNISTTASDYICLTKSLKEMEPSYFDKLFRTFVRAHKEIPQGLRFHDLRWSYINNAVAECKADPMQIAKAVGHKSCVFTMDYYYRYRKAS